MMSVRTYVLSITFVICIYMHFAMGQSEDCRSNYGDNCFANSTECFPYTVTSSSRCDFVKCCCHDYSSEEALINYLFFQYCATWSSDIGLPKEVFNAILMVILCIYFIVTLGNVADQYFAPIMAETADTLGISHNIAGVTFLAFANGAPDISSSVAALQHGGEQTKLGIGALLGVAVFNPIFISAMISTYAVKKPIKVVRFPFVRDCIFLFLAAASLLRVTLNGRMVIIEAILMIVLYGIYVTTAIVSEIYNKKKGKQTPLSLKTHATTKYQSLDNYVKDDDIDKDDDDGDKDNVEYHPSVKHLWMSIKSDANDKDKDDDIDDDNDVIVQKQSKKHMFLKVLIIILKSPKILTNYICQLTIPLTDDEGWNDNLAIISCSTAPMFFFFVFELFESDIGGLPVWVLALIFGITMSCITYYFCRKKYNKNNAKLDPIGSGIELHREPKLSQSMKSSDNIDQQNIDSLKKQPVMKYFFLLLGFLSSVAWINLAAVEVVNILSTLGVVASIDLAILGLTVLAWGNSTPDLVADVGVSKRGYAKMGIAAAIGGPTLDVLIGVGMGMTLVCIEYGEAEIPISTNIFLGCLGVMIGISSYLMLVGCNSWTMNKYIGYFLFFYYFTFLSVNILSYQFDVTII